MAAHRNDGAEAPGLAAPERPTKDEAPAGCSAQGFQDQLSTDSADSAVAEAQRKRLATLAALLARRGFELQHSSGGTWIVFRWGLSRELVDVNAIEGFARLVGAAR